MSWNPDQYFKFAGERLRPALDLLARIPASDPDTVIDLGCGAGNLAPMLRQRWPKARLIGVDGSPEMLGKARADHPLVTFVQSDVSTWAPESPVDVLYSNATLQWIPGHERFFPRLLEHVKSGGWFGIQMPRNFDAPSHTTVTSTIEQGPWRVRLEPLIRRKPVETPEYYWRLLHDKCAHLEIWECVYLQILKGENPVAEFVKGSWLKPFLDKLQEPERSVFEASYRARVLAAYPPQPSGHTLFPFRRVFIVGQR